MSTCRFQRARSPEQKAARRSQILKAAADHFCNERFENISLVDIARQAGVTKAALYRYFPSKEALFLALYLQQLERLVESALPQGGPLWEQLTRLLVNHPLFCRLTAVLHSVLEQNLDKPQAREFKQQLLQHFSRLAVWLQTSYSLAPERAVFLLLQVQQALIGCWVLSHPSPIVEDVLKEPSLSLFKVDFEKALGQHLKALEAAL